MLCIISEENTQFWSSLALTPAQVEDKEFAVLFRFLSFKFDPQPLQKKIIGPGGLYVPPNVAVESEADIRIFFLLFSSQRLVTAAWTIPIPWSIFLSFTKWKKHFQNGENNFKITTLILYTLKKFSNDFA